MNVLLTSYFFTIPSPPGGFFTGSQPSHLIRNAILTLCSQLKDEAVALVDVFAPTDYVLNSTIGASDGQVSIAPPPPSTPNPIFFSCSVLGKRALESCW